MSMSDHDIVVKDITHGCDNKCGLMCVGWSNIDLSVLRAKLGQMTTAIKRKKSSVLFFSQASERYRQTVFSGTLAAVLLPA